ncbi:MULTISPECIES: hypothetical protein [unclassified Mesorhizobium]|uniref:hypothetical protein n=1 Tax=unclassified Mesorhizobium TaxID=325217 RepID=UPI000A91186F|nr:MULTISPECIES: hypothetical protein [unclassified Mesorhizobium]
MSMFFGLLALVSAIPVFYLTRLEGRDLELAKPWIWGIGSAIPVFLVLAGLFHDYGA